MPSLAQDHYQSCHAVCNSVFSFGCSGSDLKPALFEQLEIYGGSYLVAGYGEPLATNTETSTEVAPLQAEHAGSQGCTIKVISVDQHGMIRSGVALSKHWTTRHDKVWLIRSEQHRVLRLGCQPCFR